LDLLEGVLIDLLKTKWNSFVKAKFYRQFYFFFMYFVVSLFAFGLRPKAYGSREDEDENRNETISSDTNITEATASAPVRSLIMHNLTEILCNYTIYQDALTQSEIAGNSSDNSTMPSDDEEWTSFSECPLLDISSLENRVRMIVGTK
jgi:transient receptor potential cation channel subfamily V member 5